MILVYGGTSSGKSLAAEEITTALGKKLNKELIYFATMENKSQASKERILHHKTMRDGKGFVTIEEMYDLGSCEEALKGKVVLIECMSNLFANLLFRDCGAMAPTSENVKEAVERILSDIEIIDRASELVVVTNNVFATPVNEDPWCRAYLEGLGLLNVKLASYAETFVEVKLGIKNVIKGEKSWQ